MKQKQLLRNVVDDLIIFPKGNPISLGVEKQDWIKIFTMACEVASKFLRWILPQRFLQGD